MFSVSNPDNFKKIFGFRSSLIRVFSLLFLVLFLVISVTVVISRSTLISNYFDKNDVSIERSILEEQSDYLNELNKKVESQNKYIQTLQRVLLGEVAIHDNLDSIAETEIITVSELNPKMGDSEKELEAKLSAEVNRGQLVSEAMGLVSFMPPVKGVISQVYNDTDHQGVDVVAPKGTPVHATLAGTVIYEGYTLQDGFVIVIKHANKLLSLYKHNESSLAHVGQKVKQGDVIALIGNSGKNSDGPHLHFEIWFDQNAMNPEDYIDFSR